MLTKALKVSLESELQICILGRKESNVSTPIAATSLPLTRQYSVLNSTTPKIWLIFLYDFQWTTYQL